jgi:hypothetical protein
VERPSPQRSTRATLPRSAILAAAALALASPGAGGQSLTRPALSWLTVSTEHFDVHFPAEMRAWAEPMARRIESVSSYVGALVGNRPPSRVTVIVEDPSSASNGFAVPFLEGPVIFMWPTPPTPGLTFGSHREWSEILAVHEYAHIAHLTFPPRNPRERFLWSLLPVRIGPVARKAPFWAIEGYATLVEGRLTGSGRPPSAGRAAVLRTWALDGKLPSYGQLDATSGFLGGAMRYLVGSAFLEWLEARRGESSLVYLWRRMSARQQRDFASAFSGVFGAPPEDLYGKFVVDLTAKALAVRDSLQRDGLVEGELVQRLRGATGEPALSPDGKRIALVLRPPGAQPRLVVWSAQAERDSVLEERRRRVLQLDPLDVAPFDSFPPPRRPLATLYPVAGRSHEFPRWMPDGVHILVSRDEPAAAGTTRPDLFLWNTNTGRLRRITKGASLRHADPSPDGRQAAAIRCEAGICSLVLVELASGRVRTLAAGAPDVTWHRPRWSPDGRRIAASVHRDGRWSVALVDGGTGAVLSLGFSGAAQHSPAFTRRADLVVVSEYGGVPNLALVSADSTSPPRLLTRVLGGVLAPEPSRTGDTVYFLSLHSGGYDLRLIAAYTGEPAPVQLDPSLAPAAPPRSPPGVEFSESDATPRPYGFGPRRWRILPASSAAVDGVALIGMLANVDPIGRLSVVAQAGGGTSRSWRGSSLQFALRTLPVGVQGAVWELRHPAATAAASPNQLRYSGTGMLAEADRAFSLLTVAGQVGAASGTWLADSVRASRRHGFAVGGATLRIPARRGTVAVRLAASADVGRTAARRWSRATVEGGTSLQLHGWSWGADARYGAGSGTAERRSGGAEEFTLGGVATPYLNPVFLSHYWPLDAVPFGLASGKRAAQVRLHAGLGPAAAYAVWASAGERLDRWYRVIGVESAAVVRGMAFARLPGTELRWGAGRSLDEPGRPWRIHSSVVYRP